MKFFDSYFKTIYEKISTVNAQDLDRAVDMLIKAHHNSCKVITAGNGGSAAIASHFSVDLTNAAGIRGINFNESDLITCFSNDYGYENWVTKSLEYYADSGDVVILISSSGMSPNIINGVVKARETGLSVITFSGFSPDNQLRGLGDINFWVKSDSYNIVEMTHHVWLVSIIDRIIDKTHVKG